MADIVGLCHGLWCVSGDFNMVRWVDERLNATRPTRSMRKFNRFISSFDLIDIPMNNGRFTWSRVGERAAASRLDRFLITQQWSDRFKEFRLDRLQRPTSNHFPLALSVGAMRWGPMPFRFEICGLITRISKSQWRNGGQSSPRLVGLASGL